MLNVKTHFTHTSMYLLTQTRTRTDTQTHTHSWPHHVWGRFQLLPDPLCGMKLSWVISLFIFTWRDSLIKRPTLRSDLSGTVPAALTHGFNLHPGPLSAIFQSIGFGQGPTASLIQREQKRNQGVLTILQGSLLALGLHLLSEDPCPTQRGEAALATVAGPFNLMFLFNFQCWVLWGSSWECVYIPPSPPGHARMHMHTTSGL